MKIKFEDNSWIEFTKKNEKIYITISASHADDPNSLIVNTATLSQKELDSLLKNITS